MQSYLRNLQCSRCGTTYPADIPQNLCACGSPLFAQYDLKEISRVVSRDDLGYRAHSLWRFKELLPVLQAQNVVSLFEGFTPLMPSVRIAADLGMPALQFKDETLNPTGSFKSRGLSVAVSKAKELGIREISLPTAGNAGGAAAAYAGRAGLKCHVFMPEDTPSVFVEECRAYGADVRMVPGFITDAARAMQAEAAGKGWFDVSTLKEPYRVEGKKTILLELAQQFSWNLPDVILFPTGGGTGIVGAWKACNELRELGWLNSYKMPRLYAVQAKGCAPIARAFQQNLERAPEWEDPQTSAWGLRVPKAVADFLILKAVRESHGAALAVSDDEMRASQKQMAQQEGLFVGLEAAAALAALKHLMVDGKIAKQESVVIVLTGSGLKS